MKPKNPARAAKKSAPSGRTPTDRAPGRRRAGERSPNERTSSGTREERAAHKRRAVLEATLRLLAREGPRGVTHRAVAAEAGTSLRATTYYFASRDALLEEALRHYATTASARFDAIRVPLVPSASNPVALAADLLAATVVSDVMDDRAGLVAEYELVLEIGRNAALEPAYRAWQHGLESLLAGYAAHFGSEAPERDARLVLATLRGLELEALARPSQAPNRAHLRALFLLLLEALESRRRAPRACRDC